MTGLRIADVHVRCTVLGPGTRFVVWVQGCPLSCRECVSPQWIPAGGGELADVGELADRVVREAADGLTVSGGEPFAQADAVAELIRRVREQRDLSVMAYSGFTLEHLRRHGTPGQRRLLDSLDILVDGPYLPERHADLRWRGSANQHLHLLTGRHAAPADDRGAGLQVEVTAEGLVQWLGVPPTAGFRGRFEAVLGRPRPTERRQS